MGNPWWRDAVLYQIYPRSFADANDDGTVNISDPIGLLNFLFASGAAPAAPYPTAGTDPALPPDDLDCEG